MENIFNHNEMKREIENFGEKVANTEDRERGSKLEVYREDGQHLLIVSTIPLQERFLEIKKIYTWSNVLEKLSVGWNYEYRTINTKTCY